jgi:hypothetical protein
MILTVLNVKPNLNVKIVSIHFIYQTTSAYNVMHLFLVVYLVIMKQYAINVIMIKDIIKLINKNVIYAQISIHIAQNVVNIKFVIFAYQGFILTRINAIPAHRLTIIALLVIKISVSLAKTLTMSRIKNALYAKILILNAYNVKLQIIVSNVLPSINIHFKENVNFAPILILIVNNAINKIFV